MSTREAVTVNILDREYKLACEPDERRQLLDAADYLDKNMRELRTQGNMLSAERVAVLAGLNIANELLQSKESGSSFSAEVGTRIRQMREKLDQSLE